MNTLRERTSNFFFAVGFTIIALLMGAALLIGVAFVIGVLAEILQGIAA